MRLAAPILALLCLTFLTAPDSAPLTSASNQVATDVNGEIELNQTGSGRLADASQVVVWLVPTGAVQRVSATTQKSHYRLVQHNKRFEPNLLVVPVGSVVDFPNADPWFHNVFSLYRGKRFDLGLYQAGAQRSVKFDRIGPSYLFCNIHPGMTGVVLAVESTFFGISDKAGHYSIADVPPGNYSIHVWYENATPESLKALQKAVVIEGETRTFPAISVPVVRQVQRNHKNKYGQDYDPDTLKTDY
jgi:plastocyanin